MRTISPAARPPRAPVGDYAIRPFNGIREHEQCAELQRRIWGDPNAAAASLTVAIQRHGGIALGAFDRQGRMLGFVFSFLAPSGIAGAANGLSHHSHMAGVAPELQNRGIGTALKLAQREAVLAQGLNLITWTYDPLEARNARMNLHKLGAICRIYHREYYSEMRDALNAGISSDRFEVEWWLDEAQPAIRRETSSVNSAPSQFEPESSAAGQQLVKTAPRPIMARLNRAPPAGRIEINIPPDFQAMKRTDINLARAWRMRTRLQFEEAFAKGFVATDFAVAAGRTCYRLSLF